MRHWWQSSWRRDVSTLWHRITSPELGGPGGDSLPNELSLGRGDGYLANCNSDIEDAEAIACRWMEAEVPWELQSPPLGRRAPARFDMGSDNVYTGGLVDVVNMGGGFAKDWREGVARGLGARTAPRRVCKFIHVGGVPTRCGRHSHFPRAAECGG